MPYVIVGVLLTLAVMVIIMCVCLSMWKENKRIAKDSAERDRLYKERQDEVAKYKADIPKPLLFDVPKEHLVEYYKLYDEHTKSQSCYDRCKFWVRVNEMVPAIVSDPKIVDWCKDVNHTVWCSTDHTYLMKPYVIVNFAKLEVKVR